MHALRFLACAAAFAAFSGCASLQQNQTPPMLAALANKHVDSRTYAKIVNHRVLNYADIKGLVVKGVPSPVILTYIQSTHAPYTFTDSQLQGLVSAGASSDLVNYLGKSVGFFEATERHQTGGAGKWKNNPYFNDPYFMGPPPFDYAWPGEWYSDQWVNTLY